MLFSRKSQGKNMLAKSTLLYIVTIAIHFDFNYFSNSLKVLYAGLRTFIKQQTTGNSFLCMCLSQTFLSSSGKCC